MAISEVLKGPGKTPPRLIADLLDYVPKENDNGYNLLADPSLQFRNEPIYRRSQEDCRHELMRKDYRTNAPISDDDLLNFSSPYYVSAICSSCRYHFKISVFSEFAQCSEICNLSQPSYPLHHLILTRAIRAQDNVERSPQTKYKGLFEAYEYRCSRLICPIVVTIEIFPPRLGSYLLHLIDDAETLQDRGNREISKNPSRFSSLQPSTPTLALEHLSSYLEDALSTTRQNKRIYLHNKKFMLSFANDCSDLFEYLDFTFDEEYDESGEKVQFWLLPRVTDRNRHFLQDVVEEIRYKIIEIQIPPRNKVDSTVASITMTQIKTILGYDSLEERTTYFDSETEEHPYYASLGAVEDFTDDLLCWAYDRQCECDPANKTYYFDCLEDLARGRNSYQLHTKVALATSIGDYGTNAVEEAYNYFNLHSSAEQSDEDIMDLYRNRVTLSPNQKERARSCLEKIAKHRTSSTLEALANDKTMTFDEALEFLGVNSETAPEFIEASAVVMFVDGDKSKVALALQTIAKQKPGNLVLQRAAAMMASRMGGVTLSVDDAYKVLQVPSHEISDEGILNYFQSLSNGAAAGSRDSFNEALRVIALDRNSGFLIAKLEDPNAEVFSSKIEPIGLDNIGNTCYLNSLLQYFYSVRPLREMVMNFDKYRMVLNDENLRRKKVGGRQVEEAEVLKAQKFVEELQKLFIKLKTAPTRSVRPTKELAALTIFSTQAVEQAARHNSISSSKYMHNNEQNQEISNFGSHWSSPPSIAGDDVEMIETVPEMIQRTDDNGSDTTLIDAALSSYNLSKVNSDTSLTLHHSHQMKDHEMKDHEIVHMLDSGDDACMVKDVPEELDVRPLPPDRPPPVPPRDLSNFFLSKNESNSSNPIDRLWDFSSQQDVTEVIGNVLFRLQCAITATDYEYLSGEQIDIIRQSFFGANTVYTQKSHCLQKKVEAWSYLLVFPDPNESVPRSIYEALDVSFDEQIVEIDEELVPQFTSISKLPRIMQFHIQRTAFDQESLRSWKNRSPVTIPETLYLDRYIDDSDNPNSTIMNRRRETWVWKNQLKTLEARYEDLTQTRELTLPDALMATKEWINEINLDPIDGFSINPEVTRLLDTRIAEVAIELNEINRRIGVLKQKLQNQFTGMCQYEYTLHAVFIHQGEVGGGHYWVYIYDSANDIWRQYNDESVTSVKNRDFIFRHESVGGGSPYYVVYVRSSILKDLVDPVCRDVQDVEMIGSNTNSKVESPDDQYMTSGIEELNRARHSGHMQQRAHDTSIFATTPENQW